VVLLAGGCGSTVNAIHGVVVHTGFFNILYLYGP
jgi:hypothetical protein